MTDSKNPPGRLQRLRAALLPNCREMTRRSSLAADRALTLPERLGGWLHLALCQLCRRYRRQLDWIRHAARRGGVVAGRARLSPSARTRLKHRLRDEACGCASCRRPADNPLSSDNLPHTLP